MAVAHSSLVSLHGSKLKAPCETRASPDKGESHHVHRLCVCWIQSARTRLLLVTGDSALCNRGVFAMWIPPRCVSWTCAWSSSHVLGDWQQTPQIQNKSNRHVYCKAGPQKSFVQKVTTRETWVDPWQDVAAPPCAPPPKASGGRPQALRAPLVISWGLGWGFGALHLFAKEPRTLQRSFRQVSWELRLVVLGCWRLIQCFVCFRNLCFRMLSLSLALNDTYFQLEHLNPSEVHIRSTTRWWVSSLCSRHLSEAAFLWLVSYITLYYDNKCDIVSHDVI